MSAGSPVGTSLRQIDASGLSQIDMRMVQSSEVIVIFRSAILLIVSLDMKKICFWDDIP